MGTEEGNTAREAEHEAAQDTSPPRLTIPLEIAVIYVAAIEKACGEHVKATLEKIEHRYRELGQEFPDADKKIFKRGINNYRRAMIALFGYTDS